MLFDEYTVRRAMEPPGQELGPAAGSVAVVPDPVHDPASGPAADAAIAPSPAGFPRPAHPTAPRPISPRSDADGGSVRHFPSSGVALRGPFLAFYEHFGPTICGRPLTDAILFEGRRVQVFEHLVLEEHAIGRVRPRALGGDWLAHHLVEDTESIGDAGLQLRIIDIVDRLPHAPAPQAYARRPLADIRYLVIHHTGTSAEVGPEAIAREHVEGLGWPGIGYHFVVGADGTVWRTQDPTTVSHHARQFNAVSVGIALAGDLLDAVPPAAQLDAAAAVTAWLLDQLGLPVSSVRGHRELVETRCPGEPFFTVWRPRLLEAVKARAIGAERTAAREHA